MESVEISTLKLGRLSSFKQRISSSTNNNTKKNQQYSDLDDNNNAHDADDTAYHGGIVGVGSSGGLDDFYGNDDYGDLEDDFYRRQLEKEKEKKTKDPAPSQASLGATLGLELVLNPLLLSGNANANAGGGGHYDDGDSNMSPPKAPTKPPRSYSNTDAEEDGDEGGEDTFDDDDSAYSAMRTVASAGTSRSLKSGANKRNSNNNDDDDDDDEASSTPSSSQPSCLKLSTFSRLSSPSTVANRRYEARSSKSNNISIRNNANAKVNGAMNANTSTKNGNITARNGVSFSDQITATTTTTKGGSKRGKNAVVSSPPSTMKHVSSNSSPTGVEELAFSNDLFEEEVEKEEEHNAAARTAANIASPDSQFDKMTLNNSLEEIPQFTPMKKDSSSSPPSLSAAAPPPPSLPSSQKKLLKLNLLPKLKRPSIKLFRRSISKESGKKKDALPSLSTPAATATTTTTVSKDVKVEKPSQLLPVKQEATLSPTPASSVTEETPSEAIPIERVASAAASVSASLSPTATTNNIQSRSSSEASSKKLPEPKNLMKAMIAQEEEEKEEGIKTRDNAISIVKESEEEVKYVEMNNACSRNGEYVKEQEQENDGENNSDDAKFTSFESPPPLVTSAPSSASSAMASEDDSGMNLVVSPVTRSAANNDNDGLLNHVKEEGTENAEEQEVAAAISDDFGSTEINGIPTMEEEEDVSADVADVDGFEVEWDDDQGHTKVMKESQQDVISEVFRQQSMEQSTTDDVDEVHISEKSPGWEADFSGIEEDEGPADCAEKIQAPELEIDELSWPSEAERVDPAKLVDDVSYDDTAPIKGKPIDFKLSSSLKELEPLKLVASRSFNSIRKMSSTGKGKRKTEKQSAMDKEQSRSLLRNDSEDAIFDALKTCSLVDKKTSREPLVDDSIDEYSLNKQSFASDIVSVSHDEDDSLRSYGDDPREEMMLNVAAGCTSGLHNLIDIVDYALGRRDDDYDSESTYSSDDYSELYQRKKSGRRKSSGRRSHEESRGHASNARSRRSDRSSKQRRRNSESPTTPTRTRKERQRMRNLRSSSNSPERRSGRETRSRRRHSRSPTDSPDKISKARERIDLQDTPESKERRSTRRHHSHSPVSPVKQTRSRKSQNEDIPGDRKTKSRSSSKANVQTEDNKISSTARNLAKARQSPLYQKSKSKKYNNMSKKSSPQGVDEFS